MIKIEHLTKKFGDAVVLADISMELVPGKIYGLVGRNGSGKNDVDEAYFGICPSDFWKNTGRWKRNWKGY